MNVPINEFGDQLAPSTRMESLGERLGMTEGQAYSLVIVVALTLVATLLGLPPTLRNDFILGAAPMTRSAPENAAQRTDDVSPPLAAAEYAPPPESSSFPLDLPSSPGFPTPPPAAPSGNATTPTTTRLGPLSSAMPLVSTFAVTRAPGAPEGIAVSRSGKVFVGTNNASDRGLAGAPVVFRYAADGTLEKATPIRAVNSDADEGLLGLVAPVPPSIGGDNVLFGLIAQPASVLTIDTGSGTTSVYASIPNLPSCAVPIPPGPCELSPIDNPPLPRTAVLRAQGDLLVADSAQATIWRIPAGGGDAEVFDQSSEYLLSTGPSGLAIDHNGDLLVTVPQSTTSGNGGVIYRAKINGSGVVGQMETVATLSDGEQPMGLVAGASGRIYIALAGTHKVLVLAADGSEHQRLPAEDDIVLETPMNVAFTKDAILVTNQAPGSPTRGSIVRLAVSDASTRSTATD